MGMGGGGGTYVVLRHVKRAGEVLLEVELLRKEWAGQVELDDEVAFVDPFTLALLLLMTGQSSYGANHDKLQLHV